MGQEWGLREFWTDRVRPHRETIDRFLEPVMWKVLKEREARIASGGTDTEKGEEAETLLQHLVDQTQGANFISSYSTRRSELIEGRYDRSEG